MTNSDMRDESQGADVEDTLRLGAEELKMLEGWSELNISDEPDFCIEGMRLETPLYYWEGPHGQKVGLGKSDCTEGDAQFVVLSFFEYETEEWNGWAVVAELHDIKSALVNVLIEADTLEWEATSNGEETYYEWVDRTGGTGMSDWKIQSLQVPA